ncbi:MAG: 3-hydroxybutyrate dehydrogenase [Gammaproteobacteria bacterium]|nr:3-hydroxybutyrate dehydrogenase [Gammaproteobacteria bacterium]
MTALKPRVMITGAASGIGFGIAEFFAQQGYPILLTDLNEIALNDAVILLKSQGFDIEGHLLNVADADSVEAIRQYQSRKPIGILINNAGMQFVSKLEDFPAEKWQQLIDVMLVGPAMLSRALLPSMRAQGYGRIINIGSIHSLVASPYKSAYVSAKHGLLGFSKTLALETCDTDITVNTICPAYVKTPLVEKQISDQAKNHGISEADVINNIMLKPMPKKAFIGLDEIANTAMFLSSTLAKNITGQAIAIDGGWTSST